MNSNKNSDIDPSLFILNEKNIFITKKYIENILNKYGIKHTVQKLDPYQHAMVHTSYLIRDKDNYKNNKSKYTSAREVVPIKNPEDAIPLQTESYERLEFLGDSVIHHIYAHYLYHRYETEDEGFMTRLRTKLENGATLAQLNRIIGLNKYVIISRHIEENEGRNNNMHILEDSFEAFMAALEEDAGFAICKNFFVTLVEQEIDFAQILHKETNYKDMLLQYFHRMKWNDPVYGATDISGPDHKKQFTMYIKCNKNQHDNGEIVGWGTGPSKKKGEQEAAMQALIKFDIIKNDDSESDSEEILDISYDSDISAITTDDDSD